MISLNQLSMMYGNKLLFTDVDLILNNNIRYALVGANGAGKSTLLRLMAGEEFPSEGAISIPKSAKVGWLKQDQFRYEDTEIINVVIQGKLALWDAMQEKEKIYSSPTYDDAAGYRLCELEEIIIENDGYSAEALAEKLLIGLGIAKKYHYEPLKSLSGGFKLRVLLAQTLFEQPDILLLDEPTNHLDIISIHWLEKYLKSEFKGLLVFISHDVEFISRLANYILDVDYGEVRQYSGKYPKFLEEKLLIEEQKLHEKKHVEEKKATMQKFVDRFGASQSRAKQAQSRVKMIEKIEVPDIKQSSRIAPNLEFKPIRPSGKTVLKIEKLGKRYQEQEIFNRVTFEIKRGEKVAILGSNGVGKSTLIKTLLGLVTHEEGNYEWGHETHISYFSQDHHDELNQHISVLDWITQQVPGQSAPLIRKTLGRVLFKQDDVHKDILLLSGGESARLLLARMMLQNHNILVLDEPTNHLDIESTDMLAKSLAAYTGTLIFVSHNRDFIQKIADRVIFISAKDKIIDSKGKYAEFEAKFEALHN